MIHWLLHVLGLDNGSGRWYLWWSGIVGDLAIFTGLFYGLRKLNCGTKGCWRIGHHEYEIEGVKHHLCRKHHPLHPGKPITAAQIIAHHQRTKETT